MARRYFVHRLHGFLVVCGEPGLKSQFREWRVGSVGGRARVGFTWMEGMDRIEWRAMERGRRPRLQLLVVGAVGDRVGVDVVT